MTPGVDNEPVDAMLAESGNKRGKGYLRLFIERIHEALSRVRVERVPVLTYREAVRRLLSCAPPGEGAARAAILRQPHRRGVRVVFLFIDDQGKPVADESGRDSSRMLIAGSLDDELLECFGTEGVVIFQ